MVKHAEWITGWDYGQDVCLINYQRSDGRRDMNRKIRIVTTNCIITTHWSLLIIFPDLLNYVSAVKTKRWGECKCLSTSYPVATSHSSLFSFHIPVTHIKIQIYSNNRFAWKIAKLPSVVHKSKFMSLTWNFTRRFPTTKIKPASAWSLLVDDMLAFI